MVVIVPAKACKEHPYAHKFTCNFIYFSNLRTADIACVENVNSLFLSGADVFVIWCELFPRGDQITRRNRFRCRGLCLFRSRLSMVCAQLERTMLWTIFLYVFQTNMLSIYTVSCLFLSREFTFWFSLFSVRSMFVISCRVGGVVEISQQASPSLRFLFAFSWSLCA